MSDHLVSFAGVGKMYKLFASKRDNLLDAVGLPRLMRTPAREFWALRGIDLELRRGERVGIIGRNGAGKTTVLKLLTQNLAPTEGRVRVNARVHALMDAGAGFNVELTGRQNVETALTYHGLDRPEIAGAVADIAEFTELGGFLEQPLKTYSLGMLARLGFATATAIRPEILIVDEVLGAGDAYFFGKSTERMQRFVESGASVVIVSHALDQVLRLCPTAIWLERGRIVDRGPSLEVVKGYQQFVRELEDRRLRAKNRKRLSAGYSAEECENRAATVSVRLVVAGSPQARCEVERVELLRDGKLEEGVDLGAPQDADPGHPAFVVLDGGGWSEPVRSERGLCRRLERSGRPGEPAAGTVAVSLFHFFPDSAYEAVITHHCAGGASLTLELWRNGAVAASAGAEPGEGAWTTSRLKLEPERQGPEERCAAEARAAEGDAGFSGAEGGPSPARKREVHWPGEGSLSVGLVVLEDRSGTERAVFEAGSEMKVRVAVRANRSGSFPFLPAATLYRLDGVLVTNLVGESTTLTLAAGDRFEAVLDLGPLNLGNGRYVFTIAIYRRLSAVEGSEWYDLVAHGYEFEVVGNGPFENGVFKHRAEWHVG